MATLPLAVLAVASCGNTNHFRYHPRTTTPVNVSVYINAQRVALSPSSVTQGPVAITITNQASTAESLRLLPAGGSGANPLADTGPISPQGTDRLTVNLKTGSYTITTAPDNSTQAAAAAPTGILPGLLQVQGQRPASNQLQAP